MLSAKVEQAVVKAFGLGRLEAGAHIIRDESGEIIRRFWVNSLWIIEFLDYFWTPVTLAGLESPVSQGEDEIIQYKGLLLLPPARPPHDREFAGVNPLRTIDMNWPDTIAKCLQNMNVLPRIPAMSLGGGNYHYYVYIYTFHGEANFGYNGVPQSKNMKEFCDGIVSIIEWMANALADEEISEVIDKGENSLRFQ